MALTSDEMVAAACARIRRLTAAEAVKCLDDPNIVFVDLREPRELEVEGMIPGAFQAPRGVLEFWIDPQSRYHREIFSSGKQFIFYCALGWRSALATDTAKRMGLVNAADIEGGFAAWREVGGPVVDRPRKGARG